MLLDIRKLKGQVKLNGSKSISNRLLMMQAVAEQEAPIVDLSNANDTVLLATLLNKIDATLLDAEDAGTTYRFLTAFLALQGNNQVLMGSKRMADRPVEILVDALNTLGANVAYVGREGYPPLKFKKPVEDVKGGYVELDASVSSQYISALLLIAPVLPNGLQLCLIGKVTSRPYIQMTLNLMEQNGILYRWKDNQIVIPNQSYKIKTTTVEADWSAASYFYALAGLSDSADIQLNGLHQDSVQGDAILTEIGLHFGIITQFNNKGLALSRFTTHTEYFEYDFADCPDIAQTIAVLCAGLNIPAHLTGLGTLTIKETNRIEALKIELEKLGAKVEVTSNTLTIKKGIKASSKVFTVDTYKDHRMAMAFAPLKLILPNLIINSPEVVQKSYPNFWRDLAILGIDFD